MTLFVNMIELISLLGIGLMAGASLYIPWVEVPARQDLATLDNWSIGKAFFQRRWLCSRHREWSFCLLYC